MARKPKYTKSELAKFKEIQLHLKGLGQQTTHLKKLVRSRKKKDYYNKTDKARLLKAIKSAKVKIANAGYL
mgnify:CR=1 FL=1|jgi:cell shape-determining protein MreC